MDLQRALAQEKRARLAAELLLAQKQQELSVANRELARRARALSVEVIEKREEVEGVRTDLRAAEGRVSIAEQRLWTALTTIRDGFAVFDKADRLVAANPAWLAPFDGLTAVAPGIAYPDLLRLALDEGILDIGDEPRGAAFDRMLARWRGDRIDPLVIRLWNGGWIRLVDRRGESGDMASLALDITQQMRTEASLREARKRAEAANHAKSAFLASMSHELRTPMNGVVAMTETLAETRLDDEQKSFVDTIRKSGEALLVIINDILDVARVDAGRMELHPEPFDLEQMLHDVVRLMQPLVTGKALRLLIDYDMFLPARFVGDMGRVRQILTNLIGNAVKFTPAGHVLIRVTGIPGEDGASRIHFSVEDTGIGIPAALLRHIFGEFNQADDAHSRRFEGTGLGLAITERLVRMMGGEVWVESAEGKGSTFGFRIALPAADTALDRGPVPPAAHILLAEQDRAERALLRGRLEALGLTVDARADALSALHDPPAQAAALLVGTLPDLTAAELAEALAEQGHELPVIVLKDGPDGAAGALHYLSRPVSRRQLRQALASALRPADAVRHWTVREAQAHPPDQDRRRMRVLAAEDNGTNRLVLDRMLRLLDIDLRFAVNGAEAVEIAQDWDPDLIFMDISMPGMDGKEATRQIRADEGDGPRHVPIVALTAHALDGDEDRILAAGLDHYLTKPLSKAALLDHLHRACPAGCRPIDAGSGPSDPAPEDPLQPGSAFRFQSRRARQVTAAE